MGTKGRGRQPGVGGGDFGSAGVEPRGGAPQRQHEKRPRKTRGKNAMESWKGRSGGGETVETAGAEGRRRRGGGLGGEEGAAWWPVKEEESRLGKGRGRAEPADADHARALRLEGSKGTQNKKYIGR